jgi:HK97 gp10 family phage protein
MADITKTLSSALSEMGIDSGTQRLLAGSHSVAGSYITTRVQGLAELEAALDALPERLAKKTLVAAVRDASTLFQERAQQLAPYDAGVIIGHPAWRTMHLRDGIKVAVSTRYLGAAGAEVQGAIGLDKKHVFFGRFLEFGWITARGKQQVSARPFMRPAWESMKQAALDLFSSRLGAGIAAAAQELHR